MTRPGLQRIDGALLLAVVTLFAFEGVVTTFSGRSMLRRLPVLVGSAGASSPSGELVLPPATEPPRPRGAFNQGVLRQHPDPLVGYAMHPNGTFTVLSGTV